MSKSFVKKKKIIVKSFGTIDVLGGVTGPVLSPFIADCIPTIRNLINTRQEVYEILDDGTQVQLTSRNFEVDNNSIRQEEEKAQKQAMVMAQKQAAEAAQKAKAEAEQKAKAEAEQKNNKNKNK